MKRDHRKDDHQVKVHHRDDHPSYPRLSSIRHYEDIVERVMKDLPEKGLPHKKPPAPPDRTS
jgi:hypothetical protein